MIDIERFLEIRSVRYDSLIQSVESNPDGARLDAGAIQHLLQRYAGPLCVAHRTVPPLRTGDARQEKTARVAGALIDRGKVHAGHAQNVLYRQRQDLIDVAAHRTPERVHITGVGDHGPMPTHIELIVGGKDASVE